MKLALAATRGFPIVVHSHLRWSFVWQRPQQTHSRLAERHPVLFLEEPIWLPEGESPRLDVTEPWENVEVAVPMLPGPAPKTQEAVDAAVRTLLRRAQRSLLARYAGAVHWLYTPLMEPLIDAFGAPAAIVYDCMDELSKFAYAPRELAARETRLMARASVVFTGGYELYLSKRRLHRNVHSFGCGVDFRHFHRAADGLPVPPELDSLPRPRLGYVGVIDERLDYELLDELARSHPDASLAMIGPIVKVDPASLPRGANIHYLGPRPYEQLPAYLAGFDVCLMPFAMNEASRYINPTKTLEYLATGKPVVSTPVRDVVRKFSDAVHIAPAEDFAARVEDVLAGRVLGAERGLALARNSSWDKTVSEMELLVHQAIHARRQEPFAAGPAAAADLREISA